MCGSDRAAIPRPRQPVYNPPVLLLATLTPFQVIFLRDESNSEVFVAPRDQSVRALEQRLGPLRGWKATRPARGWLRAIRDALGMTSAQYARRLGVSQPRISALEKSEAAETVSLATLRRAAEALDCELIYAIVPRRPLDQLLEERATIKADGQMARVNHTMRLEDQALTAEDLAYERERLIDLFLRGDQRRLWDAP